MPPERLKLAGPIREGGTGPPELESLVLADDLAGMPAVLFEAGEHDVPVGVPDRLGQPEGMTLTAWPGLARVCMPVRRRWIPGPMWPPSRSSRAASCDTTADWPQPSGTGRKGQPLRGGAGRGRYRPPSPNASPTAVIPAASAKAKLKITSSAPASM